MWKASENYVHKMNIFYNIVNTMVFESKRFQQLVVPNENEYASRNG